MPGGSKKGGGLEVGSAYKMRSSPTKFMNIAAAIGPGQTQLGGGLGGHIAPAISPAPIAGIPEGGSEIGAFKLKSGNSPLFKTMGSSPLKQKCTSLGCTGVSAPAGGKKGSFKVKAPKLGIGKFFKGLVSDIKYGIRKRKRRRGKRKEVFGTLDPFTRSYVSKSGEITRRGL